MEIPGPEGSQLADQLAGKLRAVFGENVKISRPMKFGEARLSGFDLSVGVEELTDLVSTEGKCSRSEIRLGPIRSSLRGIQSVWVRCPLAAMVKMAETKYYEISWSTVRVDLLRTRPAQCFKCWHYGHVRGQSSIDRSGNCFGCGSVEHKLGSCGVAALCVVCRDNGYKCSHRLGSATCESLNRFRNNNYQ